MIKSKRLLRFYFNADGLENALNNLIVTYACRSADSARDGEYWAERIILLIEAKKSLSALWSYLDKVISPFKDEEVETLKEYALLHCGTSALDDKRRREIKRVLIKFVRHVRLLEKFAEGVRLVGEYYCLL